jgi:hypothetical protein
MNVIVTTFFTSGIDPQKNIKWENNQFDKISTFYNSIKSLNLNCIIFYDELSDIFVKEYSTEKIRFIKVNSSRLNMIDVRWLIYKDFLDKNDNVNNVFFTDISDVTILKDPFNHIRDGFIYCGDEENINSESLWMKHCYRCLNNLDETKLKNIDDKKILNAGILGGNSRLINDVISKMCEILIESNVKHTTVDMCTLNYILYSYYSDIIIHGTPVNTVFNNYEKDNKIAWFKHK